VTRVERPRRPLAVPELFLGLAAIAVAVVLTAEIFSGTIKDVRHTRDTLSVTGSARVPIEADLVRWYVGVSPRAATPAVAARQLRRESALVHTFLRDAGIAAEAISPEVVETRTQVISLSKKRRRTLYVVSQTLEVRTRQIDVVEQAATKLGSLIERGIAVSAGPLQYVSTELTKAKLDALQKATGEARRRAEILVHGLGGKLGRMRSSSQGVYQVTPRDSTEVSDYGINDTTSRDKDVNAVVSVTFAVDR
jgi:uncharacterized protein